ncbi:MAG TPA: tyrosine--tRNA ligase [Tepidisphaeraceae bacterium]|nr:tyrosine--tRNA ligase [Tepidisphaeraceae bacterium]
MISPDEQLRVLSRRCERILSESDLRKKLQRSATTGKPLRIKMGMDPTAPDVHLGHAVPLSIVRQFQDWGHKAVIIIGDYTARVGDPSGRNKTRPPLSGEEIDRNAETYVAQIGEVLLTDPAHLELRYNGEWLAKMNLVDIIRLASRKTVAQILTREDFAKRYAEGTDVRLHEILYPLLQGWDSVAIDADVEMGGSDQLFNNMVGREFQQEEKPDDPVAGQVVIVTPLLVGTDGVKKMSKSLNNYIGLTDPASGQEGIFGKIMSLPDALMESYYQLLTDEPMDAVRQRIATNPRDAKIALAKHIITWLHSKEAADAAEAEFVKVFSKKEVPDEMPEFTVGPGPHKIAPLIVQAGLASSNSEAIRKVREGAVQLDGQRVTDVQRELTLDQPLVLKLGRKFARLRA